MFLDIFLQTGNVPAVKWRRDFTGRCRRTRRLACAVALFAGTFATAAGAGAVVSTPAGATPSVIPVFGTEQLSAIACMDATTCIAAGYHSYVLVHDGTNGGALTLPAVSMTGASLFSLACPTEADCYGVGPSGEASVVERFVYGEALTPTVVNTTLQSIACTPGTSSCIAVGSSSTHGAVVKVTGGVPTTTRQTVATLYELESIACPTATTCVAVGRTKTDTGGFVTITSGVVGTAHVQTGLATLTTVACASATTCWAGTDRGDVVPITSTAFGTPVPVTGVAYFSASTCPTATQCYLMGNKGSTGGASVVPVTAGVVGTAEGIVTKGYLYGITCIAADACLAVGEEYISGAGYEGTLVKSAVPTPPPTLESVTFSGTGYGLTVKVKGTNFGPWAPEATPPARVDCTSGSPSYDYAAGVLSFTDTTEGWSAGTPGSCIGIVLDSWSNTAVTFGFGTGYAWPLLANGDEYQVTVLGASRSGTAKAMSSPAPKITSVLVSGTGSSTPPTLTVKGSDLGARVPLRDPSPTCVTDDTSLVFPDDEVYVTDSTKGWTGGEYGDCLGLYVTEWSPTKVVLSFGPFYSDLPALALDDSIEVGLLSSSWSGIASTTPAPTISSLEVTGSETKPVVTVTGKGFGIKPSPDPSTPVTCGSGPASYTYPAGVLEFIDYGNWTAGETGDCIGLIIKTWTTTKVSFTFGAGYGYFRPVTAGDEVSVEVKGTPFTATAGV
jgi:hypothetical protein